MNIEDIIKENTAAVIDLTAAIRELAASGGAAPATTTEAPAGKSGKGKSAGKGKTAKPTPPVEEEEEAGDDLLGGSEEEQEEPEVAYEDIRKLAQQAIDDGKVAGLRKIVKEKLKVGSLSELDEEHYPKAFELLTALNDE